MEMNEMAQYIVCPLDGDTETPVLFTMPNGVDMGPAIVTTVGEGYPYWAFGAGQLPTAILVADVIGADFSTAPLASADYQTNRVNYAALVLSPPTVDSRTPTERGSDPPVGVVWAAE